MQTSRRFFAAILGLTLFVAGCGIDGNSSPRFTWPAGAASDWVDVKFVSADKSSGWRQRPTEVAATLYKPKGKGPFPAVMVMHTGAGVRDPDHLIAYNLMKQGYVTLVVDTYGTRGFRNTREAGGYQMGTAYQLADAYGAFTYLARMKTVDKGRIGILGSSRGGHTTIMALAKQTSLPKYLDGFGAKPGLFRAGVAYYPHCVDHEKLIFEGALLVLIGDKDREPNVKCSREVVAAVKARKLGAELKIYAGIHHVFNRNIRRFCERRNWCYNPEATADAQKRTIVFFAARLKGK